MYVNTVEQFSTLASQKIQFLRLKPSAFFIASMMAGVYVGMGIILIFSVGGQLDQSVQKIVMGASFGIALTLVVFAGAELFTGHTMYMAFGWLDEKITASSGIKLMSVSWLGNLTGSLLLACLFVGGGGGDLFGHGAGLLQKVATAKMNSGVIELFCRAILCNWLVCLALWTSARLDNDTAKCIVIFWCLFTFIASGFEHSVANMTLLSISLFAEHSSEVSISGMAHNLVWVTLGNLVGGAVFMATAYWYASSGKEIIDDGKGR